MDDKESQSFGGFTLLQLLQLLPLLLLHEHFSFFVSTTLRTF